MLVCSGMAARGGRGQREACLLPVRALRLGNHVEPGPYWARGGVCVCWGRLISVFTTCEGFNSDVYNAPENWQEVCVA